MDIVDIINHNSRQNEERMEGVRPAMQIIIAHISVEVTRKHIKQLHLAVKAPDGRVSLSVPYTMASSLVEDFLQKHLAWIRSKRQKFQEQPSVMHHYSSGEVLAIWGRSYRLVLEPEEAATSWYLAERRIHLHMRQESTAIQRGLAIREMYRYLLKEKIRLLLPKWEKITQLYPREWRTKQMKTRWGTCNPVQRRIWFNVQLAAYPVDCLEFIIVHELMHFRVIYHNKEFYALMDHYLPDWRQRRAVLNGHG
jgi:predicted metal-dependent hydrolase